MTDFQVCNLDASWSHTDRYIRLYRLSCIQAALHRCSFADRTLNPNRAIEVCRTSSLSVLEALQMRGWFILFRGRCKCFPSFGRQGSIRWLIARYASFSIRIESEWLESVARIWRISDGWNEMCLFYSEALICSNLGECRSEGLFTLQEWLWLW